MGMTAICVLGSTGSIGRNVLDVVQRHSSLQVDALVANTCWENLLDQIREFHPRTAVLADHQAADKLELAVRSEGLDVVVQAGTESINQVAADKRSQVVVAGIVGAAGLESALSAVSAGKRLLLANKEPLVMCGDLIKAEASRAGAVLLPLDSEHNAIFQSLPFNVQCGEISATDAGVASLILTGSGGPFRGFSASQLEQVTRSQALEHPNWSMGPKITIDSATMMNKALEVVEARWLFDVPPEQIEVMIHPQSIIHSMVEFCDGSVVSQMGPPDMKLPIQYAMTYPDRAAGNCPRFNFAECHHLELRPPDLEQFPALRLGYEVARNGGTSGAVLNAANEAAVDAFLNHQISFCDIVVACREILDNHNFEANPNLETLLGLDIWARQEINKWTAC